MNARAKYQCRGKNKLSQAQAEETSRQARLHGEKLEPYKCRHCGGWHTGHERGVDRAQVDARKLAIAQSRERLEARRRRLAS